MKTFLLTTAALFLALLYGTANAQITCTVADLTHPLQVTLLWTDNSTDETNFIVERQLNAGPFTALPVIAANTTQVTDTTVVRTTAPAAANTYTYRVKAVNGTLSSTYSNTACITFTPTPAPIPPNAPSGFSLSQNTASPSDTLSMTWDDLSNETSYEVFGRPAQGNRTFVKLASLAQDTTSYDWTGLARHKSYCARVRGVNGSASGPFSPIGCNTTSW